jgi:hypothetical protein
MMPVTKRSVLSVLLAALISIAVTLNPGCTMYVVKKVYHAIKGSDDSEKEHRTRKPRKAGKPPKPHRSGEVREAPASEERTIPSEELRPAERP